MIARTLALIGLLTALAVGCSPETRADDAPELAGALVVVDAGPTQGSAEIVLPRVERATTDAGDPCPACEPGEVCVEGECFAECSTDAECEDGNECTADFCLGTCMHANYDSDHKCTVAADGACDGQGKCDCEDGNECTMDKYIAQTGKCSHAHDSKLACEGDGFCSQAEPKACCHGCDYIANEQSFPVCVAACPVGMYCESTARQCIPLPP